VKRSDKNEFVQKLKDELKSSTSVIVAHYDGLSVLETDSLRKEMRDNGTKFRVTKNRLTKIALADTPYESIADLFVGPTAIAYSSDPVAPARVSVNFEKKLENFKIIGGSYDGKKN
jgi:large subunit ribosomal protein L10